MTCINKGGVWCSRTYAYNINANLAGSTGPSYQAYITGTNAASANMNDLNDGTGAGTKDNGSCCGTIADFVALTGTIGATGTLPTSGTTTANYEHNKFACVAFKNGL